MADNKQSERRRKPKKNESLVVIRMVWVVYDSAELI